MHVLVLTNWVILLRARYKYNHIHREFVPAGTNSKQALLFRRDGTSVGACAVSETSSSETTCTTTRPPTARWMWSSFLLPNRSVWSSNPPPPTRQIWHHQTFLLLRKVKLALKATLATSNLVWPSYWKGLQDFQRGFENLYQRSQRYVGLGGNYIESR